MKAYIDTKGVLHVMPETTTEAFAIKQWRDRSWVDQRDIARDETGHWKGSKLVAAYWDDDDWDDDAPEF